jgi:hypothetical protein
MTRALAFAASILVAAATTVAAPLRPQQAAARPSGDSASMPANGAVTGWTRTGQPRVFGGADLYGYIDGGAELFLEFGFERLTIQKYRSGGDEIAVEIYRMADPAAATGIYLMKRGKEARDPGFAARHTVNPHQLLLVRERYFVAINNLSARNAAPATLVGLARAVASTLPADRLPVELQRLPARALVAGSERLVRGPFGLQAISTLGEGDILQLGGRIVGVAGTLRDPAGDRTRLLVVYPDSAAATRAFANLQARLDSYLKPTAKSATRLVFKDYENRFGVATVDARSIEITLGLSQEPREPVTKR